MWPAISQGTFDLQMRLNKIKLAGFKSFVDPTTINFPSNLMGIVGPNGCGKSNVIDAIRWVLGESSARNLRGDSMTDVIFNGSSGRKPVGQASIELVFDNSDGTVTGPYASYAEIAIRRVVTRDGVSQYFLNNARCRRKDITQILLGTGLGAHGYSIIEQGMISRLVEAKPEELRAFLEEAAGISKYKERRRETEHRIRHTRENLERLADLREEIDKQLAHLQRQAKAAERYKQYKAEERRLEAELLALRLRALNADSEGLSGNLKESELALEAAVTARQSVDAELEKMRVAQADSAEHFSSVQGEYYRVGAEIARLEQSIKHRKETLQRQQQDLDATRKQLDELKGLISSDQTELRELDSSLEVLSPEFDAAMEKQRSADSALNAAEWQMEQWREKRDALAAAMADAEAQRQAEEARLEQLQVQRQRIEGDLQQYEVELKQINTSPLELQLNTLVDTEERARAGVQGTNRSLEAIGLQISRVREQEKAISARLDEVREQLQGDRGRLASLEALQEVALGRASEQMDRWLSARGIADNARLAELLSVAAGWEAAVEAVLSTHLQAVAVDGIDGLATALPQANDGSVALIEAEVVGDEPTGNRPGDVDGRLRVADLVRGPTAALELLKNVFAVESVEEALALRADLNDSQSVVTRSGVWIGRQWLRLIGYEDPGVGVIRRAEEIDGLRNAIEMATERAEDVARALEATRNQVEALEASREAAQAELGERQQALSDAAGAVTSLRSELSQGQQRQGQLADLLQRLGGERETFALKVAGSEENLKRLAAQTGAVRQEHSLHEAERAAVQAALTAARETAEACRNQAQQIAIQVESQRSSRESASTALRRVQAQFDHLSRRDGELAQQVAAGQVPVAGEEAALAERLEDHGGVESRLNSARRQVEDVESSLRQLEAQRVERQDLAEAARGDVDGIRMQLREIQVRVETVQEQFARTGQEFQEILEALEEAATIHEWTEKLEAMERRIQRLGAINLAAIDEFEEQSERKQYLDKQYTDLSEALDTLEGAIRKIDRETRARFRDTFDRANQGLGELFPKLFGGGSAYLELDSEDLLSSGVTIMARPPGKRISTIHLMSGGEKALTAVALVFSIFELNPAPFCLLDEVDAPLDEANVGRFSEIVRAMSKSVQFVIITHNKSTMESMDQLSGVTMNEPGVSRLVAVDIDEAVKMAAS